MDDALVMPNGEGLVIAALLADPRLAVVKGRIGSELPEGAKSWPAVRVTRFGGGDAVEGVLDEPRLQIDVYAERKLQAWDVAAAVRAVVLGLPGVHGLGFVTGSTIDALRYLPDTTFDPAIPRYILDVTVWAKPLPSL